MVVELKRSWSIKERIVAADISPESRNKDSVDSICTKTHPNTNHWTEIFLDPKHLEGQSPREQIKIFSHRRKVLYFSQQGSCWQQLHANTRTDQWPNSFKMPNNNIDWPLTLVNSICNFYNCCFMTRTWHMRCTWVKTLHNVQPPFSSSFGQMYISSRWAFCRLTPDCRHAVQNIGTCTGTWHATNAPTGCHRKEAFFQSERRW